MKTLQLLYIIQDHAAEHHAWGVEKERLSRKNCSNREHWLHPVISHLTNLKISDSVLRFVVKARLQLKECNTLLNLYYPGTYSKQCARCHFHTETISHILNGCNQNKNAIQKRHNRIAEIITNTLSLGNRAVIMHKDKPIKPNDFGLAHLNFVTNHTRPDAFITNHEDRSCVLVEVSVPFDSFVQSCHSDKFL